MAGAETGELNPSRVILLPIGQAVQLGPHIF